MAENEGKEPKELESEKILAQINAAKSGTPPAEATKINSEEKTKELEPKQPEKATQPTVEQEPAPKGQAEETKAPSDKKQGKPEVDIREWAKRKAIDPNDTESVLRAYRQMEIKLSQVNATKTPENVPQGTNWQPTPQVPQYQPSPMYPPNYTQPAYQPPYVDRRAMIEQEAQRFNVTPEDLERMLPIINEVTDLKLNRTNQMLQAKYDAQLAELNRGNRRNAEFNELLSDPLFTNEEVAFEINKIFESNPQRLKLEPTPWHNAFNEALSNIARRNLAGRDDAEVTSSLPSTPPKSGGKGTSPVIPQNNAPGSLIERFKDLDAKEMEKQLASIGAIPPH